MACGFNGNSDIYGIGIRIGYYTQALSLWFANFFVLREAKHLRGINSFFVFALGIAGTIYAYNARDTYAVEAFLLLQIAICIGSASVADNTRYSSRYLRRSQRSLLLRTITVNAGLVFNLCYWWRGLDVMKPTPCTNAETVPTSIDAQMERHQTYAFYFIKISLYGWMRVAMKVGAVVALVNYVLTCTARDLMEVIQSYKLRSTRSHFVKCVASFGDCKLLEPEAGPATNAIKDKEKVNAAVQDVAPKDSASISTPHPQSSRLTSCEGKIVIEAITPEQSESLCPTQPNPASDTGVPPSGKIPEGTIQSKIERLSYGPEIFVQVQQAETYLNAVFCTPDNNQEARQELKNVLSIGAFRKLRTPRWNWRKASPLPMMRYIGCYLRIKWENNPPANLRWRMSFHMTASGQYPHTDALKYLHRMRELNVSVRPPDWHILAIASDVQLSQIPLIVKTSVWAWQAVQQLIVFMLLVMQVELTIVWNHVDDLKTLGSLGQLIPFVLGVGGLLKVLWAKWCLIRKGIGEDVDANFRPVTAYEEALIRYIEWSKAVEKPMVSVSANMQKTVPPVQSPERPSHEQSVV
ncbi:MAG: hypothetical protein Q9213_004946 [Squamulea squamosa]